VNIASGADDEYGKPGIYQSLIHRPMESYFWLRECIGPYSYLHPHNEFPRDVEVWDKSAKVVYKLASLPLQDHIPQEGVAEGPRGYQWRPTDPASWSGRRLWTKVI